VNWFIVVALIAIVVAWFILYRSRFGMRLMSCGEHPQAAASVGINVFKMRWAGVLMSGVLGGIGGMAYIVPAVGDWNFEMGVAGMGFLALAVMIFGQWKPLRIAAAALFFAVFRAMANIFDSIAFLNALNLPKEIYNMMPYVASMVVLAFTSKKSRAPKAEGIPYDKGSR
jgi:simple sugar transport system permease protein